MVPWAFFHDERLTGLNIDVSRFNVKCFDKAIHGTTTGRWHEYCKNMGPTIMLLELTNGKLLGAYLSASLTDTPIYDDYGNQNGANNKGWTSDSGAFLFSLPTEGTLGSAIKLPIQSATYATNQRPTTSAPGQQGRGCDREGCGWRSTHMSMSTCGGLVCMQAEGS